MLCFRRWTVLIVVVSMVLSNAACSTMKPISLVKPDSVSQIKAGDVIRYRTVSGEAGELKVTSVSDGEIRGVGTRKSSKNGDEKSVNIADVESLEKEKLSIPKTTGLVLGTIAVLFLLMAANSTGELDLFHAYGPAGY